MEQRLPGKRILQDSSAESANPELPAFLSRPDGAPVYHGFPLVPESLTDGWCLGVISEYANPEGCDWGDAFVVAADGSRAGLVWVVEEGPIEVIIPPEPGRWGVYQVRFHKLIRTTSDLVECFRRILPDLKAIHRRVFEQRDSSNC